MKKQSVLSGMAASLLLAVGLPFITEGSFIHGILVVLVVLLSFVVLAGAGVSFLLASWKRSDTLKHRSGTLLSVALVGMMQWASVPVINHLSARQLAAARDYCESLVPEMALFRQKHGRCPAGIGELSVGRVAPDFLRDQEFLWVRTGSGSVAGEPCEFGFQFRLPGSAPLVVHRYDSATGRWEMDD